jgi:hypothetical protein
MPNLNSILISRGQLSFNTILLEYRFIGLKHNVRHIGHLNEPTCSHTNRHLDPKMCPHPGRVIATATSHVVRFGQRSSSSSEPADDDDDDGWVGGDGDDAPGAYRCAGSGDGAGVGSIRR